MRLVFHLIFSFVLLASAPTYADDAAARSQERADLLEALRNAPNQQIADAAADALWRLWFTAPDEKAQALLDAAMERRGQRDFAGAIEHLDELVAHAPDYAEGWNQRATILFLQERFDRSLDDIVKTLELEPAHFGSLSGRAVILMRQGRVALAQKALREAVAIHPYLRERGMLIEIPDAD